MVNYKRGPSLKTPAIDFVEGSAVPLTVFDATIVKEVYSAIQSNGSDYQVPAGKKAIIGPIHAKVPTLHNYLELWYADTANGDTNPVELISAQVITNVSGVYKETDSLFIEVPSGKYLLLYNVHTATTMTSVFFLSYAIEVTS